MAPKTLRLMMLGKIHRARVTRANPGYQGSISIDERLIEAAGFLLNEQVDIYDVTNGARFHTYVIPAPSGSGEVGLNGAAANLVKEGDVIIIVAYGWMREKAARKHEPRLVFVDSRNREKGHVRFERVPPPRATPALRRSPPVRRRLNAPTAFAPPAPRVDKPDTP